MNELVLTTPGAHTWTVPAGVTRVTFECEGGGGCGGSDPAGGGGGGSGGWSRKAVITSPGETFAIFVGAGGVAHRFEGLGRPTEVFLEDITIVFGLGGRSGLATLSGIGGPVDEDNTPDATQHGNPGTAGGLGGAGGVPVVVAGRGGDGGVTAGSPGYPGRLVIRW